MTPDNVQDSTRGRNFLLIAANRHLVDHARRIGVLVDRIVAQARVFVADLVHLGTIRGAGD